MHFGMYFVIFLQFHVISELSMLTRSMINKIIQYFKLLHCIGESKGYLSVLLALMKCPEAFGI